VRRLTKLLSLLLSITVFVACNERISNLPSVEGEFEQILQKTHAAGFAVAIVKKDSVIYSNGFGYRDLKNNLPVDINTLFPLGSCTQAFTSSILGLLNSDSKISFDDSPSLYIPELEFWNDTLNSLITLNTMSMHRTGLPRYEVPTMLFPLDSRDDLIQRIKYYRPQSDVNEKFLYNNHMYALLGIVAERIEEEPWEQIVEQRIFNPLDMTNSNCSIDELNTSENSAVGYATLLDNSNSYEEYVDLSSLAPAGAINSSAREMANWLMAWLNDGMYESKSVLPQSYVSEMINSIGQKDYINGWSLGYYKGIEKLEHGGNIAGFTSRIVLFPKEDLGIVVLTNQTHSLLPQIVANTASDIILELERTDWVEKLGSRRNNQTNEEPKKGAEFSQKRNLEEFAGDFNHPAFGLLELFVNQDSLFLKTGKNRIIWLKSYENDIFDLIEPGKTGKEPDHMPYLLNFISDDNGNISAVKTNSGDGNLIFERINNEN
jgi:CubicO group peptidase (beta-lactamase class C family)